MTGKRVGFHRCHIGLEI